MGSIKVPTLYINSLYMYYKNIFNSIFSFWYYYYFFFFILKILNYLIIDNIFMNFFKNKYKIFKIKFKKFFINKIFLGTFHLFKYHEYIYIYLFIYKQNFNINYIKKKNLINFNFFFFKLKMNYKYILKKKFLNKNIILLNQSNYKLIIEKRIECKCIYKYYNNYTNFLLNFFYNKNFYNKNDFNKKIYLYNIYFFDLNFFQKNWHYLFNNKYIKNFKWLNNNYYLNIKLLKYHKLNLLSNYLNINDLNLLNNYLLIEYINLLWKLQWISEWFELKKKRLYFLKKKKNIKIKVDIQLIYEELFYIRSKFLKKKNKSSIKSNYVALGFEPGNGSIFFK